MKDLCYREIIKSKCSFKEYYVLTKNKTDISMDFRFELINEH